ncbi:MAG: hypothetical protein IT371_26155 [Deltaproteobacteria bacterium]|nr:hypothetical protein [Deltaproteobacteria bacterium]
MCGIFGSLGSIDAPELDRLAEANQARGGRGFGALVSTGETTLVVRSLEPFAAERLPLTNARTVLVHLCAPTDGRGDDAARLHPFETDRVALAHNGILLNHRAFPTWRLGPVDSQVILGGIDEHLRAGHALPHAIGETVRRLDGQQACWAFDKRDGTAYLWRVMSSLFVETPPAGPRFSSARAGDDFRLVPEGRVLALRPEGLDEVARFPFSSPFFLAEERA